MATKHSVGNRINYTPEDAVDSGDVVVQEDLCGIATADIAADVLGTLDVEGVFDVAKATGSGTAIVAGAIVYWDDLNDVCTETVSGNTYMGKTILAAAIGDATARVKLTP